MSLAWRIRCVVDDAERFLAQPEIYKALGGGRPKQTVFIATITFMVNARQLRRRKATKAMLKRFPGIHYIYGPGPAPVFESSRDARPPKRLLGFMAMKRAREGKLNRAPH